MEIALDKMKKNIEGVAKFVMETEASALLKFASDLPKDFLGTIEAILNTRGRVIVSGVGKSGHVGRKIAATLASTGTPANFVHATEASHGDLGMITPADFKILHPGGNLGLQIVTVSQLMRDKSEMAIVKNDLGMGDVVSRMTESGFGVAVLVDNRGILSGVITDGDLRRNISGILTFSARDVATLNPISVNPGDLVSVALEKMEKSKIYAIVVVDKHQPVGLLRMHDVLRSGIK